MIQRFAEKSGITSFRRSCGLRKLSLNDGTTDVDTYFKQANGGSLEIRELNLQMVLLFQVRNIISQLVLQRLD